MRDRNFFSNCAAVSKKAFLDDKGWGRDDIREFDEVSGSHGNDELEEETAWSRETDDLDDDPIIDGSVDDIVFISNRLTGDDVDWEEDDDKPKVLLFSSRQEKQLDPPS